jgi:hypothetical protein
VPRRPGHACGLAADRGIRELDRDAHTVLFNCATGLKYALPEG